MPVRIDPDAPWDWPPCWAVRVYRLPILIEDQTPNIGQLWYLFTLMFDHFRAFFRWVKSLGTKCL
jgi:phosphatidylinositol glycan class U